MFFTKNKIIHIYKRKLVAIKKVKKLGPYSKANINYFKYLVRRFSNIILIIIIGSYILEIIRKENKYITCSYILYKLL
jgi:hypothetical protein